jgi:BirA family biotin operon repressor/biotin-[acetyl-CoA-carboxylase] ligase
MMQPLLTACGTVTSTNDVALDLLNRHAPTGTAVYAEAQTAGRGRQGRQWFSPAGCALFLSVVVRDPRLQRHLTWVPLAVGVAVATMLRHDDCIEVGIKWPNDLVVGGRKVGGILCEGAMGAGGVTGVVCGIGLNANHGLEDFPLELQLLATSLAVVAGRTFPLDELAQRTHRAMLSELEHLLGSGPARLLPRLRELDTTTGRTVDFQNAAGDPARGRVLGIADDGGLRVADESGHEHKLMAGEVRFVAESAAVPSVPAVPPGPPADS